MQACQWSEYRINCLWVPANKDLCSIACINHSPQPHTPLSACFLCSRPSILWSYKPLHWWGQSLLFYRDLSFICADFSCCLRTGISNPRPILTCLQLYKLFAVMHAPLESRHLDSMEWWRTANILVLHTIPSNVILATLVLTWLEMFPPVPLISSCRVRSPHERGPCPPGP